MRLRPRLAALAAPLLLQGVSGCYEYQPLTGDVLPVGEPASLVISDAGRVALAPSFGPGLSEVQGKLISADQTEFVISVERVSQLGSGTSDWSGEQVHIPRADVAIVERRELDRGRTTILAIGLTAVAVALLSPGHLTGSPASGDQTGGSGTASNRIPVGAP